MILRVAYKQCIYEREQMLLLCRRIEVRRYRIFHEAVAEYQQKIRHPIFMSRKLARKFIDDVQQKHFALHRIGYTDDALYDIAP